MNEPTYIIFSQRTQGWLNKSGNSGSDRAAARQFTYSDAVDLCRTQRDHNGAAICFPVAIETLNEIERI